jgi:hypothetical protein
VTSRLVRAGAAPVEEFAGAAVAAPAAAAVSEAAPAAGSAAIPACSGISETLAKLQASQVGRGAIWVVLHRAARYSTEGFFNSAARTTVCD